MTPFRVDRPSLPSERLASHRPRGDRSKQPRAEWPHHAACNRLLWLKVLSLSPMRIGYVAFQDRQFRSARSVDFRYVHAGRHRCGKQERVPP